MGDLSLTSKISLFVLLGLNSWHEQKTHYGIAFADVFVACPTSLIGIILIFLSPRLGYYPGCAVQLLVCLGQHHDHLDQPAFRKTEDYAGMVRRVSAGNPGRAGLHCMDAAALRHDLRFVGAYGVGIINQPPESPRAGCVWWARQDSNLRPTGYASHYSFRCPFRVCGLDCLFTPPRDVLRRRGPAVQSLHLPRYRGLARDYLIERRRLPRI
jgi:hypothetical protein